MPQYKVLERSHLKLRGMDAPKLCERGEIVDYDGVPGSKLEPICAEAKRRYVAWAATRPKRPRTFSLAADRRHHEVTARAARAAGDAA